MRCLPVTVVLLSVLVLTGQVQSQTPPVNSRQAVLQEIRAYAARHVKANSSMQTDMVIRTFSSNHAGLTSDDIGRAYEEEYIRLRDAQKPSPWAEITQNKPFIVLLALFLGAVLLVALREWLTASVRTGLDHVYEQTAGRRLLQPFALRRYRGALAERCRSVKIPFRPNRPLDVRTVYVPLKVSGGGKQEPLEAGSAITRYPRLVVVGPPGSGKSMLLRQLALSYAEGRFPQLPGEPILLLLDLHRLNDRRLSVEQHLVAELARNNFPHAERFVSQALKSGRLMLLMDGLDEVNSDDRPKIIADITDLLDRHRSCRLVVTCRSAVYRDEFAQHTERTLEIIEFNDQQIRRFLRAFEPDMPRQRSVEQLMATLRDRPRIKALARNPLLLTIIAFLYADTEFVLPHSRTEFYRQSTDFLLGQLHPERNSFESRAKQLVLQHLALFNQDRASELHEDRRSMHYEVVLAQLRKVLPDLNLDPVKDSIPLLKEVVERSGLLLLIDGGENYQFAHLTLQEYFAAAKLVGDSNGLLERFTLDRDSWREVAKLWCGFDVDSSELLRKIHALDTITALECLADSQKIGPTLADLILNASKELLGAQGRQEEVALAFAAIASDVRPRGAAAFNFLEATLLNDPDPVRGATAANALSFTNLPEAARVLARIYLDRPEQVRGPLVRMGDVAVGELSLLAQSGPLEALDLLRSIGTPEAAESIVPFLWSADAHRADRAAYCLTSLLPVPDIEEALRRYPLTDEQKRGENVEWVWQPFDNTQNSALPTIAGRLTRLLTKDTDISPPLEQWELDPRVAVPFLCILSDTPAFIQSIEELPKPSPASGMSELREKILSSVGARKRWVWASLPSSMQDELISRLWKGPPPTPADWRSLFRPREYKFTESWSLRSMLIVLGILSLGAMREAGLVLLHSKMAAMHNQPLALLALAPLLTIFFGTIVLLYYSTPGDSLELWSGCKHFPLDGASVVSLVEPVCAGLFQHTRFAEMAPPALGWDRLAAAVRILVDGVGQGATPGSCCEESIARHPGSWVSSWAYGRVCRYCPLELSRPKWLP